MLNKDRLYYETNFNRKISSAKELNEFLKMNFSNGAVRFETRLSFGVGFLSGIRGVQNLGFDRGNLFCLSCVSCIGRVDGQGDG